MEKKPKDPNPQSRGVESTSRVETKKQRNPSDERDKIPSSTLYPSKAAPVDVIPHRTARMGVVSIRPDGPPDSALFPLSRCHPWISSPGIASICSAHAERARARVRQAKPLSAGRLFIWKWQWATSRESLVDFPQIPAAVAAIAGPQLEALKGTRVGQPSGIRAFLCSPPMGRLIPVEVLSRDLVLGKEIAPGLSGSGMRLLLARVSVTRSYF